jgi:hypothetical protein
VIVHNIRIELWERGVNRLPFLMLDLAEEEKLTYKGSREGTANTLHVPLLIHDNRAITIAIPSMIDS